jgi:hypothetical protein
VDIQFASTINKKYVPGAIKFLKSLKLHNPNYNYRYNFFIIDNSLSQEDKDNLTQIYNNIVFRDILKSDYEYDSLSKEWRNWEYNCFNRFDIFLLECDRLIFFDLDMIVFTSLDEVINCECDFGAVKGPRKNIIDHPVADYFEGGLMVISKKYLNYNTRQELINLSKQKKWTSDEPVLNAYFTNVTYIPKKYNVLTSEYSDYEFTPISILQYVGTKKPWYTKNLKDNFDEFIITSQGILRTKKLQNLYDFAE